MRRPRRTSRAGRERSAAENRRPQTCQPWRITRPQMCRRKRSFRREAAQIAEQSSARAKRSARKGPRRAALMQRRGSLSDRSRRQSCDCRGGGRNARRAYAQGIARLARYPPHDDRHRTQASVRQGGSAGRLAPPLAARPESAPIRRRNPLPAKSLHGSFSVPKIYLPLILLALSDIRDNLSRIFRDKCV